MSKDVNNEEYRRKLGQTWDCFDHVLRGNFFCCKVFLKLCIVPSLRKWDALSFACIMWKILLKPSGLYISSLY